jgi:hypothetical protein
MLKRSDLFQVSVNVMTTKTFLTVPSVRTCSLPKFVSPQHNIVEIVASWMFLAPLTNLELLVTLSHKTYFEFRIETQHNLYCKHD